MNPESGDETPETAGELSGQQRRHLRALANPLKPLVQVGEAGPSEAIVSAIDRALDDHELIKVRLRQPADKKAIATNLAARAHAHLCGLVGHTVILYRRHPEKPRIELPGHGA